MPSTQRSIPSPAATARFATASTVRSKVASLALVQGADGAPANILDLYGAADIPEIDTAFARKQAQTEQIGAFERARAAELTDLTQAYADLTRDDLP